MRFVLSAAVVLCLASLFSAPAQAAPHQLSGSIASLKTQVGSPLITVQAERRRVRRFLRDLGFEILDFVERTPPEMFLEVCKGDKKYLVMFTDAGRYFGSRYLGECVREQDDEVATLRQIRRDLRSRGYRQVRFTDRTPPSRIAEACRRNRSFELRINAEGRIVKRQCIGRCQSPPVDEDGDDDDQAGDGNSSGSARELRRAMRKQGYRQIRFVRHNSDESTIRACHGIRRFHITLANEEINARRTIGFCDINEDDVEWVPPRPVQDVDPDSDENLSPETCQQVLDWLQYRTPILFEVSSDRLKDESLPLLRVIARNVDRCPGTQLHIEGHTDDAGSSNRNRELSEKRAIAVQKYLSERDTPASRLRARGYGEDHPIVPNTTDEDRARNRRIDFVLEWDRR